MAHDDGIDDNDIGYSIGELLSYLRAGGELVSSVGQSASGGGDHAN